ncbi:MAG: alanine--glyoxylate aminotransferase family protein [Chloroflexi bacterium]|nr:alanine--glyoxylate aminotransferase family protein [Chloroflexota bacterium]
MNLRTPGPTPLPPSVREALTRDMVDHRGPAFAAVYKEVDKNLHDLFSTTDDILLLTCSGTGGLEASVANFFSAGDKVLVVSIGYFGDRYDKISRAYGLDVTALKYQPGQAADPADIQAALEADPGIAAVMVTHNDTSTGTTNDVEAIGKVVKGAGKLFLVDAISSIGSIPLETTAWGCDVVVTAGQKSWMIPPGLAFVSVSPPAWERHQTSRLPRFYFDLTEAKKASEISSTPWTPAISLFYALQASLRLMKEEGLSNILARHARLGNLVRGRLAARGLKPVPEDQARASNTVTAFYLPEGADARAVQRELRERFDVHLAGGQGSLAGKILRIGHLGYVQEPELNEALDALETVLELAPVAS